MSFDRHCINKTLHLPKIYESRRQAITLSHVHLWVYHNIAQDIKNVGKCQAILASTCKQKRLVDTFAYPLR